MAYDLILRRQSARDFSRGPSPAPTPSGARVLKIALATGTALGVVQVLATIGSKTNKWSERRYYQREFRDNPRRTQEIPVTTMRDMVYGGG